MPTQTFLNLPENKRKKILKAAKQEFSRVPLEQASIANIIKIAEIPRGSFYQYFYNKEDLFAFIVSYMGKNVIEKVFEYLNEAEGNLIEAFIKLFYYLIDVISRGENEAFSKNILLNMNDRIKDLIARSFEEMHLGYLNQLIKLSDTSTLIFKSKKEIIYILKMIKGILFQNIACYFNESSSKQEVVETYLFQMRIIKQSIYKA